MADADNYKIKIKDLALFVSIVQLSPAVRMEKTSCKYPIRRVEVKVDTVPRGCVDSDALNGPIICTDLLWAVNDFRDVNPLLAAVVLS
jgi:hypothetical protein